MNNAAARLGAFAAGLVAIFLAAAALGAAVGPISIGTDSSDHPAQHTDHLQP